MTSTSSSVFALNPRSEEYRRVDYLLKLSLRSHDVRDVSVWHFANAHQASRFEQRTAQGEVLHAWVAADELEVNLDSLAARGFVFGQQGQKFTTGTLASLESSHSSNANQPKRFILCQIGVGKSYVQDDPRQERPDGYDSVFIAQSRNEHDATAYRHEYVLFDPAQALPMYLVQYFPGPPIKKLTDWPGTGPQGSTAASNQRNTDSMYDRYDFFDPVMYVPVSVRDKMVGSHSVGEAAQHKLISIADAYDSALAESLKPDPLLAQRQSEIKSQLRAVDAKLRDVNRNSAEIEERIYKALQDALFQLQDATQQKLNLLLSEEVELRRQLQHIDWIETFLDREREEAEQVDFLNAWKCHVQLRGDMCRRPLHTVDVLNSVHADLELEGSVQVVSMVQHQQNQLRNGAAVAAVKPPRRQPPAIMATIDGSNSASPSRRGTGSMSLNGGGASQSAPSPIQQKAGLATTIPTASSTTLVPVSNQIMDVDRAFAEALRLQTDSMLRPNNDFTRRGSSGYEEVPPTPPKVRPIKNQIIGKTAVELVQFSLTAEANRKCKTMGGTPDPRACFSESRLLNCAVPDPLKTRDESEEKKSDVTPFPLSEAQALFMTLPVRPRARVELLYATWQHEQPRIADLINSIPTQQVVVDDGDRGTKTVVAPEHVPTVLIVRANGKTFGGYASDSWRPDGIAFGSAKSFLFSVDRDVKIPFTARDPLLPSPEWVNAFTARGLPKPKYASLLSDTSKLQFGNGDLVLSNDFKAGASELEHGFGLGLLPESPAAETFLADAPRFVCDQVELWAVRD